jgi:hypothetical protein
MRDVIDQYTLMLIKQYWEKPRARAEIEAMVSTWQTVADLLRSLDRAFDLDFAVGKQLDIIGRIVGVPRNVPAILQRVRFGFSINPVCVGFADRFDFTRESAPFFNRFDRALTSQQLDDEKYRRVIRVKVAKNSCAAVMSSDDRNSLQDVIRLAFDNRAYIVDNQDMTITLYISPSVSTEEIRLLQRLDLLPRPQTVNYKLVIIAEPTKTFGFSLNPNSLGFSDRFNAAIVGGNLARKFI